MRTAKPHRSTATLTACLLAAGALAACGADGEGLNVDVTTSTGGEAGRETSDTALDDTDEATSDQPDTDGTATEVTNDDKDADDAGTSSDLVPAGTVLMSDDEGVHVVGQTGSVVTLTDEPAERAHDDGAGGFVFEAARPDAEAPSPAIHWQELGADDTVEVVAEALSDSVRLRDGGLVDGSPAALFTVFEDGDQQPENYEESIQYRVLPDGDRERVRLINSFEGGFSGASLGGDTVAYQEFQSAYSGFSVVDLAGEDLDVPANPSDEEGCFDSVECPTGLSQSADGELVAWRTGELDGTTFTSTLVVAERDGTPVAEVELPAELYGSGVQLGTTDVDDGFAVVNRVRTDNEPGTTPGWLPALKVDLASGEAFELPVAGHASLGTDVG